MILLQIEHNISDYDTWKKAFDSDPLDRKGSGVVNYKIMRPADNPNYIIIQLAFDNTESATAMQNRLQAMFLDMKPGIITNPSTRILRIVNDEHVM